MPTTNVVEMLVKAGVLDDRQHDAVMSRAKSGAGGHLVQQIADLGYATESTVARILSVELGLPRVDLSITPPEHEALSLLDMKTCLERFVLPVALRENGDLLWLAMGDPTDTESMAVVRRKANKRVRPVVAGPSEILREARKLYAAVQSPGTSDALHDQAPVSGGIDFKEEPDGQSEAFEIVNVADDSAAPIQRLAEQLGVPVPEAMLARRNRAEDGGIEIDVLAAGDPAAPPANLRQSPDPAGLRGIGPSAPGRGSQPGPQQRGSQPGQQQRGSQPGQQPQRGSQPGQPSRGPPPPPSRGPQPGARPVPPSVGKNTIRGWRPGDAGQHQPIDPGASGHHQPIDPDAGPQRPLGGLTGPNRPLGPGFTGPQRPLPPDAVRPRPPVAPAPPASPFAIDEVLWVPQSHGLADDDLAPEDVLSLDSLRSSMEKGALVLRAVAELCVEKGLFTREEMRSRSK